MTTDTEGRPASLGVRFLRHWLVRFVVMFTVLLFAYAGATVPLALAKHLPAASRDYIILGAEIAALPLLLLLYVGLVRIVEGRRTVAELTPSAAPGGLIAGAIIGAGLFTAVIGILFWMGHAVVVPPATITLPAVALALSLVSGVGEELLLRGVMFRIVEERFGTLVGLIASAALFGALHIGNPGATVTSSIAIALEAGLLLALAYGATRSLWLPIGLHFAWNFTEGGIFTTQVSGGKVPGILKTTLTGPDLLTGGSFGPEASVIAVAVCMTMALVFLIITIRRGDWKPLTLFKAKAR